MRVQPIEQRRRGCNALLVVVRDGADAIDGTAHASGFFSAELVIVQIKVVNDLANRGERRTTVGTSGHAPALAAGTPMFVLDMFEHAYALDDGAAHANYIDAFFTGTRDACPKLRRNT